MEESKLSQIVSRKKSLNPKSATLAVLKHSGFQLLLRGLGSIMVLPTINGYHFEGANHRETLNPKP